MAAVIWRAKAFAAYHLIKDIILWTASIIMHELLRVTFPSIHKSVVEKSVRKMAGKLEESESDEKYTEIMAGVNRNLFSWSHLKEIIEMGLSNMGQSVYLNGPAADTTVVDPKSNQLINLFSLTNPAKIHKINSLVSSFDKLKWVMVYIAEAHASDGGWSINDNYMSPKQHTQLQERLDAIEMFEEIASPKFPVYADHMDNNTSRAYGGLPERIYAVRDGTVVYQGPSGPAFFDVADFENWLKANC